MPKPKSKSKKARKRGGLINVHQRRMLEAIGYGLEAPPAKRGGATVVGSGKKKKK